MPYLLLKMEHWCLLLSLYSCLISSHSSATICFNFGGDLIWTPKYLYLLYVLGYLTLSSRIMTILLSSESFGFKTFFFNVSTFTYVLFCFHLCRILLFHSSLYVVNVLKSKVMSSRKKKIGIYLWIHLAFEHGLLLIWFKTIIFREKECLISF
jgi:hypothetical protein